jgi:hypothetical protein
MNKWLWRFQLIKVHLHFWQWVAMNGRMVEERFGCESLVPEFSLIQLRFIEFYLIPHPWCWGCDFKLGFRLKPLYSHPWVTVRLFCNTHGLNPYQYFSPHCF